MTSASSSSLVIACSQEKNSTGGRPPKEVWNYIQKGEAKDRGHYSAKCECGKTWTRGKPKELEDHLATECPSASIVIKQKFLRIVSARNHTNERDNETGFPASKKARTNEPQVNDELKNSLEKKR